MQSPESMSTPRRSIDPDALLAEAGWVRSLARKLVPTDRHLADDLAQDAYLAALKHAPETERSLHSWLATVLRNLVRQDKRANLRRLAREEQAARAEAQGSTLEHVETLSVHRRLVEAVMALEEPYRETLVLRYFEELSPSAIAKRQKVPVATVKTRLARGLAELRVRLEREYRDESRSWALALVPLCTPRSPWAALTVGTVLMSTKLKIAASLLLLAGLIAVAWPHAPAAAEPDQALAAPLPHKGSSNTSAPLAPESARPERTSALPNGSPSPAAVVAPREASVPLAGILLDVSARPLIALHVQFQVGHREISSSEFRLPGPAQDASLPRAESGADGRFTLDAHGHDGELVVAEDKWTTVLSSLCRPGNAKSEHIVVAAPRLAHSGRVVDPAGKPLAGARLELRIPKSLRLAFPQILDASAEIAWIEESGPDGAFRFPDAPRVEGATIEVSLTGYRRLVEAAPLASNAALELVLQPIDAQPGMVYGEVLDPQGAPVAEARITIGHRNLTLSDEHGQFHLELPKDGERDEWIALKPGFQPAIETASAAVKAGQVDPGELVVLRLGPAPLTLAGRVVDESGKPQEGWRVFLADPTFFGASDEIPAHVEGILSGAAERRALEKRIAGAPEGTDPGELLRDLSTVFWTFVITDAGGNFTLEGLLDRNYRVAVLDPKSLLRFESGPFPAGTRDALVRVPGSSFVEGVHGRVLSMGGKPVPGVSVRPGVDVLRVQIDAHSMSSFDFPATPVVTDAEGRFRFARLPREQATLSLRGEDIVPAEFGTEGGIGKAVGDPKNEVVIHVELSFHVQIDFEPGSADQLQALDAEGKQLSINLFEGNNTMSTSELQLEGGRSKIFVLGEKAATLVLHKDGKEVRRAPLALAAGQLNRVQF